MSGSHFSSIGFAKPIKSSDSNENMTIGQKRRAENTYAKGEVSRLTGLPILETTEKSKLKQAGFGALSAFDRHKKLVNNYLTYYGSQGNVINDFDCIYFSRSLRLSFYWKK
jgi:hypothetical protein